MFILSKKNKYYVNIFFITNIKKLNNYDSQKITIIYYNYISIKK